MAERTAVGLVSGFDRLTPHPLYVCVIMLNLDCLPTPRARAVVFFLLTFGQQVLVKAWNLNDLLALWARGEHEAVLPWYNKEKTFG